MKNRLFVILSLLVYCFACVPKSGTTHDKTDEFLSENQLIDNEKNDFPHFLSLFEDIKLPVILDESFLNKNSTSKKQPIDTAIVSLFIEKPKDADFFDYYTFYPMGKFHVSSSIIGVIYLKYGAAGGFEDYFILSLYSTSGEKMDELLVGEYAGDLGFVSLITSIISQSEISLVETYFERYEDEEGSDDYREVSKKEKRYKIDTVHRKIEIQ